MEVWFIPIKVPFTHIVVRGYRRLAARPFEVGRVLSYGGSVIAQRPGVLGAGGSIPSELFLRFLLLN